MPTTIPADLDRPQMRDVTVLAVIPIAGSTAGASVAVLGIAQTVDFELNRTFSDSTAAADIGESSRAIRWGKGSVKITGFSSLGGSKLASIFAAGSHTNFMFTEATSGDSYQLLCTNKQFSKSLGKDNTTDTLTLEQEGVPMFGAAGESVAEISLD